MLVLSEAKVVAAHQSTDVLMKILARMAKPFMRGDNINLLQYGDIRLVGEYTDGDGVSHDLTTKRLISFIPTKGDYRAVTNDNTVFGFKLTKDCEDAIDLLSRY